MLEALLLTGLATYASTYALAIAGGASTFLWHHTLHNDPQNPNKVYLFTEVTPDEVICITFGGKPSTYIMEPSTATCFGWQAEDRAPDPEDADDWNIVRGKKRLHGPIHSKWGWFSPWYALRRTVNKCTGTHLVISPLGWQVETRVFQRIRHDIVDKDGKKAEIFEPRKDFSDHLLHAQFQLHIISAGVPAQEGYDVHFHVVLTLRCTNPVLAFWEARGWEQQIAVRVQSLIREFAKGRKITEVYAGATSEADKTQLAGRIYDDLAWWDAEGDRPAKDGFLKRRGFEIVEQVDIRDTNLDPARAKEIESFLAAAFEGKQAGKRQQKTLEGVAAGNAAIVAEELKAATEHGKDGLAEVYLHTRAGVRAAERARNVDALIGMDGANTQTGMLGRIARNQGTDQPTKGE